MAVQAWWSTGSACSAWGHMRFHLADETSLSAAAIVEPRGTRRPARSTQCFVAYS